MERLAKLADTYPETQFSCLIDDQEAARAISAVFAYSGQVINVYLDLNVGMNRTGIRPGPKALAVYQAGMQMKGLNPIGLHAYDGHIRDTDLKDRKEKCDAAYRQVTEMAEKIAEAGGDAPVLVAGGSPTFPIHAQRTGVECSPGTFVFWDWGYQTMLPDLKFQFAALVLTRVISRLDEETLCLDLGHKAIAAENPFPRVHFLNAPDARPVSQSEEHLVVKVDRNNEYKIGDVFYGVPIHICPTCALYEQAYPVEQGQVSSRWKVVSRNRFITI